MSGLFGVVGKAFSNEVDEMATRLAHRGKLRQTLRIGDDIVIGAVGSAPADAVATMRGHAIACTGRISNRWAAVDRLRGRSVAVRTTAELLLATVLDLGIEALGSIEGEFAFAIVDTSTREVTLGRDFFGLHPIYYSLLEPHGVAFASEYKAILCLPEVEASADLEVLQFLQLAKKMPEGRTVLRGVHSPPPGSVVSPRAGERTEARSVYSPLVVDRQSIIHSEASAAEQLRSELRASVERQASDLDPIGLALSGGIDSIGLAFLLRELYPGRAIHTFSAGSGSDDPELSRARTAASSIGSTHHEILVLPGQLEANLGSMVWHLEDPIARTEAAQLFEIGRRASQEVPVVLVGVGADSLFTGMPRHRLLWLMSHLPPVRTSLGELYDLTQVGLRPDHFVARSLARIYFDRKVARAPLVVGAKCLPPRSTFPAPGPEFINRVLADGFQEVQCQDAPKYERAFSAWGVSYRSPFCDLKLARFAFTISDRLKIQGNKSKVILRKALSTIVPGSLLDTPKVPQRMRVDSDFTSTLSRLASTMLSPAAVRDRGMFAYDEVSYVMGVANARPPSYERAMRLWTLILTELWARAFLDRRGAQVDSAM